VYSPVKSVILAFPSLSVTILPKLCFSKEILLEDWDKGIVAPTKACNYFGCSCIFQLNGNTINLNL